MTNYYVLFLIVLFCVTILTLITVHTTSSGNTLFAWYFILNGNIELWLTISYQEAFVFSISVLCFQIFTVKLIFTTKNGSCQCNIYIKLKFWKKIISIYFLHFFTDFKLLILYNDTVKIIKILNKWNLLETCVQTTYPIDLAAIYTVDKMEIF